MTDAKMADASTEAPKIAVAVKTAAPPAADEPEAKRLKPTPPDAAAVKKQVEYYLSDDNLRTDKFFHEKISGNAEGWLEVSLLLSCNKMKTMRASKEDVLAALKGSKIEIKEDQLSVRRPGNLALPALENKPQHQKKSSAHAHDGGVISVIQKIPAEQSWMQIKEKLREKLPDKVQLWFVSEVSDKSECIVASAPFDGDLQFFEDLVIEVGNTKLKTVVAHGDVLQQALKVMPKHIRDKREKEVRKRQKERNRPILVGSQRFVTVHALRIRVKEILNARSDGEQLKVDGSDYKLIQALLSYHPKGETKSKGLKGIKVAKSSQGDSRCFWMVKETGEDEDFSAQKCLNAIEANPPYVEVEAKKGGGDASPAAKKDSCTVSCICGACSVETVGVPKWVCNCHCSQCRRALSASYATLAGFDPENIKVIKGQDNLVSHTTGKEERFSCKTCSSKVYAHLHHLKHKAIYNDMFTKPNHGPDGKIGAGFKPTMHIFYTSGNTNVCDGLPKFEDLPAAFGGSDKKVDEVHHTNPAVTVDACTAACICGACEVTTKGAPKWVVNCHCSQCRRALSSTYATLAGFDPDSVNVTKGQDNLVSHTTGKEERFSCKICSSKVYAHLHHLSHKAIYNDMFTTPNHGPDGKIGKEFAPTMHIFYTSGNTDVVDGLPKFVDLPAAFGGSDKKVEEPKSA